MAARKRKRHAPGETYRGLLRKAGITDAQAETFLAAAKIPECEIPQRAKDEVRRHDRAAYRALGIEPQSEDGESSRDHRNGNGKPSRWDMEPADMDYDQIRQVPIDECHPSPENEHVYRTVDPDDPKIREMRDSILEYGIKDPLVLSLDFWILSGHRRHAGAKLAGLETVPVRFERIWRGADLDAFLTSLREHNRQREKTFDERMRENLIDINPNDAMAEVMDEQVRRARCKSATIYVPPEKKKRNRITRQTRDFANAIVGVLTGPLADVRPVPERAVHYHLQNMRPRVRSSRGKNGFFYDNDKRSSAALSRMLTRLRLVGEVDWDWISDETRPVGDWDIWNNAAEFLKEKTEDIFSGFARGLMQSQSAYYEIVLEKLTIKGFIDKVAARYTIRTVTLRGNSGIDARYRLVERFKRSGKKFLRLFVLADLDPSGDMIAESTVHSLRDEFGIDPACIKAVRVALTHEQADKFGITKSVEGMGLEIKKKLAKAMKDKFIREHDGREDCYELEAILPANLSDLLDKSIRSNIDIEAYNYEVDEQAKDVANIRAARAAAKEAIRP